MKGLLQELADRLPTAADGFVIEEEVEKLIAVLEVDYPGLVDGYVRDNRARYICGDLNRMLGANRNASRAQHRRPAAQSARASAANGRRRHFSKAAAGGTEGLRVFLETQCVDSTNRHLAVGKMRGKDHKYVAGRYTANSKTQAMLAAFHSAVAEKVGTRRTEEVMSEEEYVRLRNSIVRS